MKFKFIYEYRFVILFMLVVTIAYIPVLLLMSDDFGFLMYRSADEAGYFDTIRRIHLGITHLDFRYAFSGTTYAYGFGYFLLMVLH